MQSDDAIGQNINALNDSENDQLPSDKPADQNMNVVLSDEPGIQTMSSIVESKNIEMESACADEEMDSVVESHKIQVQSGDANASEVNSKNILLQSDRVNVQDMDASDNKTQTPGQNCDGDNNIQEVLEVQYDGADCVFGSDEEEDGTSCGDILGLTVTSLETYLEMDFAILSVDTVGLLLLRSDGGDLELNFVQHLEKVFQFLKWYKQNEYWRCDLPSAYARALQACLNGFRLMDFTLEARLHSDHGNVGETDDLNQLLYCALYKKLELIWARYYKTAHPRICSALFRHSIDTMTFKFMPCPLHDCPRSNCIYYHDEGERRKKLVVFGQRPYKCKVVNCEEDANCELWHKSNDMLFHYTNFLSKLCPNMSAAGECKFTTPCSFAHTGTPDMFYHPNWKDLYVVGLEKSYAFLVGAIRNILQLRARGSKKHTYAVLFITSQQRVADAALSVIRLLEGTHITVAISKTGNLEINCGRAGIVLVIRTLARIFDRLLKGVVSLILDDATALLSESQAPLLRRFLSTLPAKVNNYEAVNKVVVCSKVNQTELQQMEELMLTKFLVKTSIPNLEKCFASVSAQTVSSAPITKGLLQSAAATKQQEKQPSTSSRWDSVSLQAPATVPHPSSRIAQSDARKSSAVVGSSIVNFGAQAREEQSLLHSLRSANGNVLHQNAGSHGRFDNRISKEEGDGGWNPEHIATLSRQRYDGSCSNHNLSWKSGDKDAGAPYRHDDFDGNRSRHKNSRERDAGALQRNRNGKKRKRDARDADSNFRDSRSRSTTETGYIERPPVPQWNTMQSATKGDGRSSEIYHPWAANLYPPTTSVPVKPGFPVEKFHPQAGMAPDHNQSGISWQDTYSQSPAGNVQSQPVFPVQKLHPPAVMVPGHDQSGSSWQDSYSQAETRGNPFKKQAPNRAYSPGIEGTKNLHQWDRRSQNERIDRGSRPVDRNSRDSRKTVQAPANSGSPKFSDMDDKLKAVLAPVSAVKSVGPAVEAIVAAAREFGANTREALALFADKDHATILSVYFNTLEETSANLNDSNQYLVYQRAVAFGRAILNMARRDAMGEP